MALLGAVAEDAELVAGGLIGGSELVGLALGEGRTAGPDREAALARWLCESQMSFRRGPHLPAAAPAVTERHLYFARLSLFRSSRTEFGDKSLQGHNFQEGSRMEPCR
jgi:hypothetical protein